MLKFESWPPTAGKVSFSGSTLKIFRERDEAARSLSESDATIRPINDIAFATGRLIRANADLFTSRRIGQELAQSIGNEAMQELFNLSYDEGLRVEDEVIQGVST